MLLTVPMLKKEASRYGGLQPLLFWLRHFAVASWNLGLANYAYLD